MELSEYLAKHNVKHREFAMLIGLHPKHVGYLATGKRRAGPETALRIETVTRGEVTIHEAMHPRDYAYQQRVRERFATWEQATALGNAVQHLLPVHLAA